ncbi:TadE/TadG family type IV pilus assembly protein [Streptomyces sp. NBC_01500]|uniref:TadE/TadG family type IV pilus assembly protein n=1 Tax=Streptomyces sp. NBC_01500 TaxID=2903886 RepID=UPI00225331CA|nr:TadE family protein [Streptomyces sp. NBC_01500]MCX4554239.1 pilus assembly protein [Streptomyces sp. NBC_01500]
MGALLARYRQAGRRDAGISTLEFMIVAPVLLIVSCMTLQLGIWYLASTAAHTAARKGAQAGSAYQSSPGEGAARASSWLGQVDIVKGARVSTAGSTAARVKITVTGHIMTFLPGWSGTIERSAEDTVERTP